MSTDNGSGGSGGVPQFRKFVSEAEMEEKKRQRQEEWERVRKPQDPVEAPPEEPEDSRSLYDRLQEQKNMKQAEYEEKFQLKNQVRGLDDEEANFLDEVSRQQENIQREKDREERDLLEEYRNSVANRVTAVKPATTSATTARPAGGDTKHKPSQAQLLAGVVKRKRTNSSTDDSPKQKEAKKSTKCSENDENAAENKEETRTNDGEGNPGGASVMVVAGVLPGIGVYRESDSDDSDSSSDSDIDTDLFRRTKVIHASADH